MAISILPPAPAPTVPAYQADSSDDSSDAEGDTHMGDAPRPSKRPRLEGKGIVTPGESITDDPQWMR